MKKWISFLICAFCICLNLAAQNTFVFLGSYNWNKSKEGIYVYQLDTTSGQLTRVIALKGIHNPSFITLSPDGRYLYACTESKTPNAGSVSSFAFDPDNKTLTFLNSQPSGGENPAYVMVNKNGKWLANANYTAGSASVYPIMENGSIGAMAQNIFYTDSSINKERQNHSHVHAAVFSPACDYIYFTDLGADKIRCYRFDTANAAPLQSMTAIKTSPGSGPRHFTFHPNGQFAYCIEEIGGAVSVYQYKNGQLDSLQRIYTHPKQLKGDFESSDVHISPDGRHLYATNRGKENNLAIFSIRPNGKLKLVGYQSTGGDHPRTFSIDPSGKFIIVTNVISHSVTVFKRNVLSGLLTKVYLEPGLANVSCVQIKQY
jgi:6-phosphogluconolactonase (cycloisomerase 2 family)